MTPHSTRRILSDPTTYMTVEPIEQQPTAEEIAEMKASPGGIPTGTRLPRVFIPDHDHR